MDVETMNRFISKALFVSLTILGAVTITYIVNIV